MLVTTADGRTLEVIDAGGSGLPVLFHSGTPMGSVPDGHAIEAARAVGLRWLTYGRPGYGDSTPQPGRIVADAAADSAAVLDALDLQEFVAYGASGGGPHVLACAALLPERCRAVAVLAGVAPWAAEGLDFLDGMGPENVEEFGKALEGRDALLPLLEQWANDLVDVTGAGVADSLGGLVPQVDRDALTGAAAEHLAAAFRRAVSTGVAGWVDDDLAFTTPWGFDLSAITVPVTVLQGGQDLMVPLAHGRWLGEHVAGAVAKTFPEHGHLSLGLVHLPQILADLADLAGLAASST